MKKHRALWKIILTDFLARLDGHGDDCRNQVIFLAELRRFNAKLGGKLFELCHRHFL